MCTCGQLHINTSLNLPTLQILHRRKANGDLIPVLIQCTNEIERRKVKRTVECAAICKMVATLRIFYGLNALYMSFFA